MQFHHLTYLKCNTEAFNQLTHLNIVEKYVTQLTPGSFQPIDLFLASDPRQLHASTPIACCKGQNPPTIKTAC